MSWRAPWLRERLLLLSLALWDLLVVWGMYASIYRLRLGEAPGFTFALAVLVLLWLGGSYLLGRYTQRRRGWIDGKCGGAAKENREFVVRDAFIELIQQC